MSLVIQKKKPELCPPGKAEAVIVDVIDLGYQNTFYGNKHMISLVFETKTTNSEGLPFRLAKRVSASLHERSRLRQIIESVLDRRLLNVDLVNGVDIELLQGKSCVIEIEHDEHNQNTYANVVEVNGLSAGSF